LLGIAAMAAGITERRAIKASGLTARCRYLGAVGVWALALIALIALLGTLWLIGWDWEHGVKLIEHGVNLIGNIAWPVVAVLLLIKLEPSLAHFIGEAKAMTFKGAGFEASVTRDTVASAAALGAAVHHKTNGGERPKELPELAPLIEKASSPRSRRKLQQSIVLWVDDCPENNLYERRALEALGIHVDLANDSRVGAIIAAIGSGAAFLTALSREFQHSPQE
jgi:hypothetical protein